MVILRKCILAVTKSTTPIVPLFPERKLGCGGRAGMDGQDTLIKYALFRLGSPLTVGMSGACRTEAEAEDSKGQGKNNKQNVMVRYGHSR